MSCASPSPPPLGLFLATARPDAACALLACDVCALGLGLALSSADDSVLRSGWRPRTLVLGACDCRMIGFLSNSLGAPHRELGASSTPQSSSSFSRAPTERAWCTRRFAGRELSMQLNPLWLMLTHMYKRICTASIHVWHVSPRMCVLRNNVITTTALSCRWGPH